MQIIHKTWKIIFHQLRLFYYKMIGINVCKVILKFRLMFKLCGKRVGSPLIYDPYSLRCRYCFFKILLFFPRTNYIILRELERLRFSWINLINTYTYKVRSSGCMGEIISHNVSIKLTDPNLSLICI